MQVVGGERQQVGFVELGRGGAEMADVEALDQFVDTGAQLHRIGRAKPRHQRQKRHRFNPAGAQIAQGKRAEAFRERFALRPGQQRMVGEFRHRAAKRLDDLDLRRGVGHMVRATHHVGNPVVDVVADRGQRIEKLPVAADQHRVRYAGRVDRQVAQNAIGPFDPLVVQLEAPVAGATLGAQLVLFGFTQVQSRAVIDRRFAHVQLFLALQVQFGRRLETLVKPPAGAQLIRRRFVAVQPGRLPLQPVPGEAQPGQVLLDRLHILGLGAFGVGIVDAQDKRPLPLSRDHVVEQRGAQVADMQITRGGRGETGGGHWHAP